MIISYQLIGSTYDTELKIESSIWNYLLPGVAAPGVFFTGTEEELKLHLDNLPK